MPPETTLTRVDESTFGQYPAYYKKRVKELAEALEAGRITVDEWEAAMKQELEDLHHAAYMVGAGKEHNLTNDDLAKIAIIIAAQVAFLLNWAKQLRSAEKLTASAIEHRANLYLNAADATIQKAKTNEMGMPELPAYPRDGQSQCLVNCLCHWRIEKLSDGNWDCYWELGEPETVHCDNCPKRALVWSPLRIRGGEIEPYETTGLFAEH